MNSFTNCCRPLCAWRTLGAVLALGLLGTAAAPLPAASTLEFSASVASGPAGSPAAQVWARQAVLVTLYGPGAEARAQKLAALLNQAADKGLAAKDFTLAREGKDYLLRAAGRLLLRVDRELARRARSSPETLARTWLANLRQAFGLPYLSLHPSSLLIPVSERRWVQVSGKFKGDLSLTADERVAAVSLQPGSRISVLGLAEGETQLIVQDQASRLQILVRVARYAGGLARGLHASVTGPALSPPLAARAAEQAVRAALRLEPGAWARVGPAQARMVSHSPPAEARVSVPVAIEGPRHVPVRTAAELSVPLSPIAVPPAGLLVVSNNPERLASFGLWHEAALPADQSLRFLYHHVNASGQPADLVVELLNLSARAARLWMTEGLGGPSSDELYVGHLAAHTFLARRFRGAGFSFEILPRSGQELVRHPMRPGQVVSGLMEIASLAQADLRLRLRLAEPHAGYVAPPVEAYAPSPLLSRWQFPSPNLSVEASYRADGPWAFVEIGEPPLVASNQQDRLPGAYGAIYQIQFELSNPTPRAHPVELRLRARGGAARAVVSVDGTIIQTGILRANEEVVVARRELPPGAKRTLWVLTMPQSGSNYPVTLFVRPVGAGW